ncbi:hypothetical protein GQ457_02G038780 [Hibiscus cannabinus]
MSKGSIIKVEDNLKVREWSRSIQKQKGDSLATDHESTLSEFTHVHLTQNNLQELKEAWDQLGMDMKQKFQSMYGDIAYLLNVEVDLGLIRALTQFWSPSYSCFTFNQLDMTPTIEEYTALLHLKGVKLDQVYTKAHKPDPLVEKLMKLAGMGKAWAGKQIHKRGNSEGITWNGLRSLLRSHPDPDKSLDILAVGIYGLVIFPKSLGYIEAAVIDLFGELRKINPAPAMLAETFRSLSNCRKKGGGHFVGCAQLLTVWFHSHYGEKPKPTLHAFTDEYSPLGEFLKKKLPNFTKDKWIAILRNLRDEDVKWYVSWLPRLDILYKCGEYDWVPLSGIWGGTGYAPLMVQRQYGSVQFIPVTAGLDLADFSYKVEFWAQVKKIQKAWNQPRRVETVKARPMFTIDYEAWRTRRGFDNIPLPDQKNVISFEEHLKVVPTEVEVVRHECEVEKNELKRRIRELEAQNRDLDLDVVYYKKQLRNVEKERDQLAEDFTDLQASHQKIQGKLKVAGMRKTTEEWERELREQEMEAGRYKKLFLAKEKDFRSLLQDMQRLQQRSNSTWGDLVKSQAENQELKDVVSELEESLQNQYQNASKKLKVAQEENQNYKNLVVALENSLQEYKQLIIDLRAAVKADRDQWNLTLKITRGEVRKREDLMTNVRSQVRKVAEKIAGLADEAEVLKLKVGSTSHCGKELTRFLDEIEKLGVRAGLYLDSFALI